MVSHDMTKNRIFSDFQIISIDELTIRRHLSRCLGVRSNGVNPLMSVVTTFKKIQLPTSTKKNSRNFENFLWKIFENFFFRKFSKNIFPPKLNFKQLFSWPKNDCETIYGLKFEILSLRGLIINFSKNLKLTQKNLQKPVFWGYLIFFKIFVQKFAIWLFLKIF